MWYSQTGAMKLTVLLLTWKGLRLGSFEFGRREPRSWLTRGPEPISPGFLYSYEIRGCFSTRRQERSLIQFRSFILHLLKAKIVNPIYSLGSCSLPQKHDDLLHLPHLCLTVVSTRMRLAASPPTLLCHGEDCDL